MWLFFPPFRVFHNYFLFRKFKILWRCLKEILGDFKFSFSSGLGQHWWFPGNFSWWHKDCGRLSSEIPALPHPHLSAHSFSSLPKFHHILEINQILEPSNSCSVRTPALPKLEFGILAAYSMYLKGKQQVLSLIRKRMEYYLEFLMHLDETRSNISSTKLTGWVFSNLPFITLNALERVTRAVFREEPLDTEWLLSHKNAN